MSSFSVIKIVIADDHAIFRTGVRAALQSLPQNLFLVIGEVSNGQEAMELLKFAQPDIVLMDVEMPTMNGIEATTAIKQAYPLVRTIALSYANTSSTVLGMISAGADGYLLKDTNLEELTHAIRTVHTGVPYFSPATSIHFASKIREEKEKREVNKKKDLTPREKEILSKICESESSKEIAISLFVSKRTVDSFREKIMRKTGVRNVFQLIRYAIKNHLIKD